MDSARAHDDRGRFEIEGVPANVRIALRLEGEGYRGSNHAIVGPTDALALSIHRFDPEVAKRLEDLEAEFHRIFARFQDTTDEAELEACAKRLQVIQEEMVTLQPGDVFDVPPSSDPDGG